MRLIRGAQEALVVSNGSTANSLAPKGFAQFLPERIVTGRNNQHSIGARKALERRYRRMLRPPAAAAIAPVIA